MTKHDEQLLREAFSTLVPEAPASATDARPVVLKARQRRHRLAASAGAAALVVAAVAVPVWLSDPGGDGSGRVSSDAPPPPDPWTTLPCTDLPSTVSAGFDPASATSARLCVVGDLDLGFPYPEPPADALVSALDIWRTYLGAGVATRLVQVADPARCATRTVQPTPVRLLVEQADGSRVLVDANLCGDVTLSGVTLANSEGDITDQGEVTVDGGDVARSFLAALAAQRADLPAPEPVAMEADCSVSGTFVVPTSSLAPPLAATRCGGPVRRLRPAVVDRLFGSATHGGPACEPDGDAAFHVVTIDAYGDTIRWEPGTCGDLVTVSGGRTPDQVWRVPNTLSD